jgi:DNA-binding response OmpR family regulator
MARILMVQHATAIAPLEAVLRHSHEVRRAVSLADARALLDDDGADAVVLDVDQPDGDGLAFITELRRPLHHPDLVVVVVTTRDDLPTRLMGFAVGCDDWLSADVHPLELGARLDAHLRRLMRHEVGLAGLHIDLDAQRASLEDDAGHRCVLALTALEFRLLVHFARHVDHVIDRDHLLSAVWGDDICVLDRTVDTHVSHLRRKLVGSAWHIEAVPRAGYRFTQRPPTRRPS